ncbi:MAG: hypothetical protein ABI831_00660 [Betaproteobacteria bacterium]
MLTGCVVDNVFYSVEGGTYRINTPPTLDLRPFEGNEVSLYGALSPGDRFNPGKDANPKVKQAACPAESLRRIKKYKVMRLSVDATKAADAGEFDRADKLIAQAMALSSPIACDTFAERAYVMALKGELVAAAKDLAIIKSKKCHVEGRMNPLLLQDVGIALRAQRDKGAAISAFGLALAACDSDPCRRAMAKDLQAAKNGPLGSE